MTVARATVAAATGVEATEHVMMVRRNASHRHAAKSHGQDEVLSMRGERRHDWPLDVTWTPPERSSHMIRRAEVRDPLSS